VKEANLGVDDKLARQQATEFDGIGACSNETTDDS